MDVDLKYKNKQYFVYVRGKEIEKFEAHELDIATAFMAGIVYAEENLLPGRWKQDRKIREEIEKGLTMPIDVYESGKL